MASMRWASEDFPAGESAAEVTIDVPSVESGSRAHDDHLRSAGFFDVARHHTAGTFAGRASGRRGRRGLLAGELTSRGVTRPVTLQAGYLGHVAGLWGGQRAIFTAEGTLNRDDRGLTWNMPLDGGGLPVSKDIRIEIGLEAVLRPGPLASLPGYRSDSRPASQAQWPGRRQTLSEPAANPRR